MGNLISRRWRDEDAEDITLILTSRDGEEGLEASENHNMFSSRWDEHVCADLLLSHILTGYPLMHKLTSNESDNEWTRDMRKFVESIYTNCLICHLILS